MVKRLIFYGPVQHGFRQARSTTDCVLRILSAQRSAKRKKHCISLAFSDIAKSHDKVYRQLLYTKLHPIGFGGQVVALIRSIYFNDCVWINLCKGLSNSVDFMQGVKQGCSMSQILFGLYIASLNNKKMVVRLGQMILTALFFADDLLYRKTDNFNYLQPLDVTKRSCPSSWFGNGRNNRRRINDMT